MISQKENVTDKHLYHAILTQSSKRIAIQSLFEGCTAVLEHCNGVFKLGADTFVLDARKPDVRYLLIGHVVYTLDFSYFDTRLKSHGMRCVPGTFTLYRAAFVVHGVLVIRKEA
jgi:hypothetical protein